MHLASTDKNLGMDERRRHPLHVHKINIVRFKCFDVVHSLYLFVFLPRTAIVRSIMANRYCCAKRFPKNSRQNNTTTTPSKCYIDQNKTMRDENKRGQEQKMSCVESASEIIFLHSECRIFIYIIHVQWMLRH